MSILYITYDLWKTKIQGTGLPTYHSIVATNQRKIWSGHAQKILHADVDPTTFADWQSNFESGSILVPVEDNVPALMASVTQTVTAPPEVVNLLDYQTDKVNSSTVNKTTSSTTILAANPLRLRALIYNNSNKTLYLRYGAGGDSGNYSVQVPPNGYYEPSYVWIGALTGAWATGGTGEAQITEFYR